MRRFEYHVAKPLRLDLEGEGLVTVPPGGRVFSEEDVASWGRAVDALVDQGKLVRMPVHVGEPAEFTDEELLAELDRRGLHISTLEQTEPEGDVLPDEATLRAAAVAQHLIAKGAIVAVGDGWKLAIPAEPDADAFPKHEGGGWYLLSNGEKVQGREAAAAAQADLSTTATE